MTSFDTSRQVYAEEATGWQRGLYEDVQATFRAPVVNWIWRTLTANDPAFTRYLWGQVKPLFGTRGFGAASVAYRDAVLSAVEESSDGSLPAYRSDDVDVAPAEWRELRAQLATFDVVAPRLAVLFEATYRCLDGDPVGTSPDESRASTAPLPDWLDRDRGASPTLVGAEDPPEAAADAVDGIRAFHGFEEGLPSVYRCLLQWPDVLASLWTDLRPALESAAFDRAADRAAEVVDGFVEGVPYRPRLTPADLERLGRDPAEVEAIRDLFEGFARGPVETVLPAVPLYAAALGVEGERGSI